jgi:uncharacterized Zn finger protein
MKHCKMCGCKVTKENIKITKSNDFHVQCPLCGQSTRAHGRALNAEKAIQIWNKMND